jgi:hypothetical protein
MTDTIRTQGYLRTNVFQSGQAPGSITSQDERDLIVSVDSWIAPAYQTLTSSAGATTWATAGEKRNNATITLDEDSTLSITGAVEGAEGFLKLTQDGTGGWTFTLPAGTIVGATTDVNTTASKTTAIAWSYDGSAFLFVLAQEA